MKKLVDIKINGKPYLMPENITILEACKRAGISIPTLCYLENITENGHCGICVVEIKGARNLQRACITKIREGMEIFTDTPLVRKARKTIFELILANHKSFCPACQKELPCEIRKNSQNISLSDVEIDLLFEEHEKDRSIINRDATKCIACRRCVNTCEKIQGINTLIVDSRGFKSKIAPPYNLPFKNTPCVFCGQCVVRCPTGALTEKDDTEKVLDVLQDPDKYVVVSFAPAVRASIGELFGLTAGNLVIGKLVAALRRLGFKKVFDVNYGADLTIVEEANELIERLKFEKTLPMFTSCCPAWVRYVEEFYPEMIPNLSTCKSPQAMLGAVIKNFLPELENIPKDKIIHVTIMPCTAKKYEILRPDIVGDIDYVLTVRELAKIIKQAKIDLLNLKEEEEDIPFGEYSGAAAIFGVTGGVMEAALRTAVEWLTGETFSNLEFTPVRGLKNIRIAEINIKDIKLKVAIAHTLKAAQEILERIKRKELDIQFLEVMACPGGCIGGGGQPIPTNDEILRKRAEALYNLDKNKKIRKSHENPFIKFLYEKFLGNYGSEKAHKLLHAKYSHKPNWEDLFSKSYEEICKEALKH